MLHTGLHTGRPDRAPQTGPRPQEDGIDTLWPRLAPPTVKTAVLGILLMLVLVLVNIVTVLLLDPSGAVVLESVLIGAGFLVIVAGISRRAVWARYVGIGVAALFAFAAAEQLRSGVPGIVLVVYVVQLVVLLAVAVALLLRPSGEWFRNEI